MVRDLDVVHGDIRVRGKQGMSKVQSGVQTVREYNFHDSSQHSVRSPIDDIDPRIVKRVWRYRFGQEEVCWKDKKKLSKIVHSRFQKLKPEDACQEFQSNHGSAEGIDRSLHR
jgi:hypothetical protein